MESHPPPIHVLLIDPNKEDREYWTERLTISSPAFSVLEAETGAAGLAICRSQRIDCVVLELTLPDMSGFQVLSRLVPHAFRPELPVIVFSRRELRPLRRLAITNGAQTYLMKSTLAGHELSLAVERAIAAVAFQKRHRWQAAASQNKSVWCEPGAKTPDTPKPMMTCAITNPLVGIPVRVVRRYVGKVQEPFRARAGQENRGSLGAERT